VAQTEPQTSASLPAGSAAGRLLAGGTAGNELLMIATGAVLIVLPALKLASTGYRFVRYYVWAGFTSFHVLGHLPTLARGLQADYRPAAGLGHRTPGRTGRALSLASALIAGAVLAALFIPQFAPWLHFHHH